MRYAGKQYTGAHGIANKMERIFRGFEARWKPTQAPAAKNPAGKDAKDIKKVEESETVAPNCPTCNGQVKNGVCEKGHRWEMVGGKYVTPVPKRRIPTVESDLDLREDLLFRHAQ